MKYIIKSKHDEDRIQGRQEPVEAEDPSLGSQNSENLEEGGASEVARSGEDTEEKEAVARRERPSTELAEQQMQALAVSGGATG